MYEINFTSKIPQKYDADHAECTSVIRNPYEEIISESAQTAKKHGRVAKFEDKSQRLRFYV